jgi:cytoskeletal protein CcmA (bactofilin family)
MKKDTEKQTLVEEGTEFTGTMRARCKVVVRGSMDGDLEAPAVEVSEGGTMTGNVKAKVVHARGILAGSVEADEISLAGIVRSNTVIRAKSLSVNLASDQGRLEVTFGDTVLEVGDMPSDQPAVAETTGASTTREDVTVPIQASSDASEASDDATDGRKKGRKTKTDESADSLLETADVSVPH